MMRKICKQCGKEFELGKGEIDFYKSRGLKLPARCKECREKNKAGNNKNENNQTGKNKTGSGTVNSGKSSQPGTSKNNKLPLAVIAAVLVVLALLAAFILPGLFKKDPGDGGNNNSVAVVTQTETTKPADNPGNSTEAVTQIPVEENESAASITPAEDEEVSVTAEPTAETEPAETLAPTETPTEAPSEAPDEPEIVTVNYKFRNTKLLNEHYEKHGKEMGFSSAKEYQAAASAVVNNPDSLHKTEAEDGDDVYYLEDSNEFVIVSTDGYIRTYFLPSGGKSYYDRQ